MKEHKTLDEIANEVIDGKWGNDDLRKRRLMEAGYDYLKILDRVEEIKDST